ncbi:MAG TPA: hypothetical protein VE990_01950 [Acidimicrobiales bacterium]|nr:hypothetical protein [Acidimicrobiales bacterium]
MARFDQIKDAKIRDQAAAAHGQLRAGKPADAVRTLADGFLELLSDHPEVMKVSTQVRGRALPVVARWPALGANLVMGSGNGQTPRIEFVRDRFAVSEALTYFEFFVDLAVGQGL